MSKPLPAFSLDARLRADTTFICDWPLSRVLLVNDSRYPWLLLVPRRSGVRELYELELDDQVQLGRESLRLAELMSSHFAADKMNIAAIGNVVSQLHVHQVARFTSDATWPGTVWGVGAAIPYTETALANAVEQLRALLA